MRAEACRLVKFRPSSSSEVSGVRASGRQAVENRGFGAPLGRSVEESKRWGVGALVQRGSGHRGVSVSGFQVVNRRNVGVLVGGASEQPNARATEQRVVRVSLLDGRSGAFERLGIGVAGSRSFGATSSTT